MRVRLRMPAGGSRRATTRMARLPAQAGGALLCALVVCQLAGPLAPASGSEPAWTTYHHDPWRSGEDPEAGERLVPALAWQSANLGAPMWGQPLVLGGRVYGATVGDQVFALDAATGAVLWSRSLGTPVPSSALPCGDIFPTVGVVGTPVIDTSTQVIYAVADTWDSSKSEAHHQLVGLRLASGEEVLRTPVDPPGADPKALLQRTALNLDQGRVVFGFGGNDGDCAKYRGAVVTVPEGGGAASQWQVPIAAPAETGGGVWAASGPAVDGEGHIYAATGNPNPPSGQKVSTYDHSDSVVKLDSSANLLGSFATPNWASESNTDRDLSSAGPEPLPGGLVFQAGKTGIGYLVDETGMGSGGPAVYSHQVCGGSGSFGGDAFAGGVIYLPCTSGVQALAYNQPGRAFTPLWQGPGDAFGGPIVSAGLVWSIGGAKGAATKLYGLDPATGGPRYTVTLPSPVVDHFGSPSAGGGRLFVATGSSITAYRIANPLNAPAAGNPGAPAPGGAAPGTPAPGALAPAPLLLLHKHLHRDSHGRVRLQLRCLAKATPCRGILALRAKLTFVVHQGSRQSSHVVFVTLARTRFASARRHFVVTLHLDSRARARLRRHRGRMVLQVVIACPGTRERVFGVTLS
jgi:outer membrane protein assembly factor BamB